MINNQIVTWTAFAILAMFLMPVSEDGFQLNESLDNVNIFVAAGTKTLISALSVSCLGQNWFKWHKIVPNK